MYVQGAVGVISSLRWRRKTHRAAGGANASKDAVIANKATRYAHTDARVSCACFNASPL